MNADATSRDSMLLSDTAHGDIASWRTAWNFTVRILKLAEPYGQSTVLLSLRLLYGWQFAQTGWGKLMNLERTAGFFESIAIPAPLAMAALVGSTELLGGSMLAFGVGTRFAAGALTNVMITALLTAHADEAFRSLTAFTEQEPFPFLMASLVLLVFGAGWFSADGWLRSRSGASTARN